MSAGIPGEQRKATLRGLVGRVTLTPELAFQLPFVVRLGQTKTAEDIEG